ncbi:winged helix-turn-helix domain-containing protein [Xanthomonadaceae bacterium XH05]|nr:winged helix-turn-helix domain-containing protein [Xanthomonadaceae bacterium XH05]
MQSPPNRYRFDTFLIDARARQLLRDDEPVPVQSLVFDLLLFLVQHPGQTLSKDRLLAEVWHNQHLTDATIAQAVRKARAALGDDGRAQTYIRTVHGHGIRFEAEVQPVPLDELDTTADAPPSVVSSSAHRIVPGRFALLTGLLLALVAAVTIWQWPDGERAARASGRHAGASQGSVRMAVFPFENATGDADFDWFQHGLAMTARDLLAQVDDIEALGPNELDEVPEGDLGQRTVYVGARYGLSATVSREEGRFAVAWSLAQGDGRQHHGQFAAADATLIARELARQALEAVGGTVPPKISRTLDLGDPLALELYARGMEAAMRDERESAVKLLEAALARAPDSIPLKVAVAQAAFDPADFQGSIQRLRAASDALPQDASLARVALRFEVGKLLWFVGEVAQAEPLLRAALDEPGIDRLLRARILNSLAMVEQSLLHFDPAWEHARSAESLLRQLDSPYFLGMTLTNLGYLAEDMGRLAEAERYHREALDLREMYGFPSLIAASRYGVARVLRRSGRFEEAAELVRLALDTVTELDLRHDIFDNCEEMAEIDMRLARFDDAERWLERARTVAESNDDALGLIWVRQVHGRLALRSQAVDAAVVVAHETVLRDLEAIGERQDALLTRLELAQMHLALAQPDAAATRLSEVADALEAGSLSEVALGHAMVRAQWMAARGERDAALAALLETVRRARSIGATDLEAEAAILAGHLAIESRNLATAGRMLAVARAWSPGYYRTQALAQALQTAETGAGKNG